MTPSPEIQIGARFTLSSFEYEIAHASHDTLRAAPCKGGAMRQIHIDDFLKLKSDGRLVISYVPPNATTAALQGELSGLDEAQIAWLNRKRQYVLAAYKELSGPCSQRQLRPLIQKVAGQIGDQDAPSTSTVAGWVRQWVHKGKTDAALMKVPRKSRPPKHALPEVIEEIIQQAIKEVYLTKQRNTIAAAHFEVTFRVTEYNRANGTAHLCPSFETVRKHIHRIDLYRRDKTRMGNLYAARKHRAAGQSFSATEPCELAMADGQIMDVLLVDEKGELIGRPYLTVIMDVCTRCVLSAYISLTPFSGATLIEALKDASVSSAGKPRGIMTKLVVDNGSDYRHNGFLKFCQQLGIIVEPCPPRSPNSKAIIERFFRTLNEGLIHKMPGTTFSNPTDRGDYDSQKFAQSTLDDLRRDVEVWIDEIYHTRIHSSLGEAPIDVWTREVALCQP